MDQQSALRFVRREAPAFGGDPERVTIFGQSAGASSVQKHLVMPGSRGLFQAAIMESGATHAWPLRYALGRTRRIAEALGCLVPKEKLKECLRHKSVRMILQVQGTNPNPNPNWMGVAPGARQCAGCADGDLRAGAPDH